MGTPWRTVALTDVSTEDRLVPNTFAGPAYPEASNVAKRGSLTLTNCWRTFARRTFAGDNECNQLS